MDILSIRPLLILALAFNTAYGASCTDKCNFDKPCTKTDFIQTSPCSYSCVCDGEYTYHLEDTFTQCGRGKRCYQGDCLSEVPDQCENIYGSNYLGLLNPSNPCVYYCLNVYSPCIIYEENVSDGGRCYTYSNTAGSCFKGTCASGEIPFSRGEYFYADREAATNGGGNESGSYGGSTATGASRDGTGNSGGNAGGNGDSSSGVGGRGYGSGADPSTGSETEAGRGEISRSGEGQTFAASRGAAYADGRRSASASDAAAASGSGGSIAASRGAAYAEGSRTATASDAAAASGSGGSIAASRGAAYAEGRRAGTAAGAAAASGTGGSTTVLRSGRGGGSGDGTTSGSGSGDGTTTGSGSGDGTTTGSGSGDGTTTGSGNGYGATSGSGNGYGATSRSGRGGGSGTGFRSESGAGREEIIYGSRVGNSRSGIARGTNVQSSSYSYNDDGNAAFSGNYGGNGGSYFYETRDYSSDAGRARASGYSQSSDSNNEYGRFLNGPIYYRFMDPSIYDYDYDLYSGSTGSAGRNYGAVSGAVARSSYSGTAGGESGAAADAGSISYYD